GLAPDATYQFKHALIRDAAYEALLKSRRKELHLRVAQTIDSQFATLKENHPEVLARHWTEAGEIEPAVAEWTRAGKSAESRNAFPEARESYQQAMTLLKLLPESTERDARELELMGTLAQVLMVTRGFSAPEMRAAAERARDLAEKGGNPDQLATQLIGIWQSAIGAGEYSTAGLVADRLLDLAQREGSPAIFGFAYRAQIQVTFFRGDLATVDEHFAHLSRFLDADGFRQFPGAGVEPVGIAALSAWTSGRADSARERMAQGIAFARDSGRPYDLAVGRLFEGLLCCYLREPMQAEVAAAQALAIAQEHGFPFVTDLTRPVLGRVWAELGRTGEGVALIRQGLAGLAEAGSRPVITFRLTNLAEAQALDGKIDDALITIEQVLQANPEELVSRPYALTCRGELQLKLGRTALAEADLREAITLAQKMSAKAWELRAATSLARLLGESGRRDEARAMLKEIYGWFTEGFDTADLKEAKALLEELGA
ncbi:MAG TPA: hypothetical protein VHY56_11895, partial [Candidatus Binataceae bacterium]|nr:hypothetical protein [Candidatus Binataceae bacterium]